MNRINRIWQKVSRIGLREGEGVMNFREVIFLNRIMSITPVLMLFYMPLEIYLNGFATIHLLLMFMGFMMLPLLFNYFRWFAVARYYSFIIGICFIIGAGLTVGRGVNNHVALIPMSMLALILFKTNTERVLGLCFTITFYLLQQKLFQTTTPSIIVPPELLQSFSIIFFILSLLINFLIGHYFIAINREYEGIVIDQKDALADKNKEITASITYAKRIQSAILPPARLVKEYLPQSFILYKPKDIVAGDFYWMEKTGDSVLLAAADSTGHGVPGAMVSVVCHNALARSVREFGLTQPAKILDKTREIIIEEFEKSEEEVQDGMDISLCALDLKTYSLQWAGANNPLLIIRNSEILETKADKQPVGKFSGGRPFTNHHIELKKGDSLYIFTDGYADQFGGPDKKKLKYKNFKQWLLNHHGKPMEEQKQQLDLALELWKGELEQVDDVCVIGVKI